MNVVLIVPTGIGCEIGGHCGDAQPVARLIGSCCDRLITHPNVVNASDMNEMPENTWYVEGSILDRFLEGQIALEKPYINKVLVAVNKADYQSINAVSAARCSLGMDAEIVELIRPLQLIAKMKDGIATGDVYGWEELVKQIKNYSFDALAIATPITIDEDTLIEYFKNGGVNPVGGVEAVASKLIADKLNKPVAHGPVDYAVSYKEVVDPRQAVELITENFIHCLLKGLHQAPRISIDIDSPAFKYHAGRSLMAGEVDVMISPYGCWGRPHTAFLQWDKPIIFVKENKCVLNEGYPPCDKMIVVDNYIEAAGMIQCMKAGVHPPTVRRPIEFTKILKNKEDFS
jgi:hypothetical protein